MRQAAGSHAMFIVVALAVAASDVRGQDQEAQEPRIVEIDTLNVRDTLYHLSGGGGNALALVDELNGGVVLVDTKLPGWGQAVADDGTFKSADELRELYARQGVDGSSPAIAYCRIGERSSHTWFALRHLLGYENVRNYDGSWTEWGSMVGMPIENPSATQ